ncbi:hypothetical protein [Acidiphilium acidophilum]|uniref:Uncharacterized protein n=1 Tax=Acidiphilium acidophilum TaxID=76588 RepID=A0AAW9DKZ7_ACIAO|nr:hypothetical protein [Acidiphilium acidophilum]MDX5929386.1 hypothetical protein [Acidiphilium acidophilum]
MAFRSVREKVAAEIEAGATIKMIWQNHFGDQSPPLIGYRHFADLVSCEVTNSGSRGERTLGGKSLAPASGQTAKPPPAQAQPSPTPSSGQMITSGSPTEIKTRKFIDFGNLESTLDRWYPPKERNQLPEPASSSAPGLQSATASSNHAAASPATDQLKGSDQPHEPKHQPADGLIFSLDHPDHDTLFQPACNKPPE